LNPRLLGVMVTLALLSCEDVLGINGSYESTPAAFCSSVTNACGTTLNPFNEGECETALTSTPVNATQYISCRSLLDAGSPAACYPFVHCLDQAIGSCPFQGVTSGMPCTNEDQAQFQLCCSRKCNAPEGGVGTCE
jgi:hypothetical protein